MRMRKRLLLIAAISIITGILLPTSVNFSQSHLKINDVPGSGGNNNSNQSSSSDKTFLYVVGGAILVGIVAYALLRDKKKEKEVDSDTSSAINNSTIPGLTIPSGSFTADYEKTKEFLPVEIILGIIRDDAFIPDNKYLLGVSLRF